MTCKHCERTVNKSEPVKICPMHGRSCGVCMTCFDRMTSTVPPEVCDAGDESDETGGDPLDANYMESSPAGWDVAETSTDGEGAQ